MKLRFEHVSDCDSPLFPALIALVNAALPTYAMSLTEAREMDRITKPEQIGQRWLAFQGDQPVVLVGYAQELTPPDAPLQYRIRLRAAPGTPVEVLRESMVFLETKMTELGPRTDSTFILSLTPEAAEVLQEFGFSMVQKNPYTELQLQTWEPPFEVNSEVAIRQIFCTSTGETSDDKGYYELHNTLLEDVPMPTPYTPEPPEDFFKFFETEFSTNTKIYVAEVEGRMIGMTEVHQNSYYKDMLNTGLTGVRREHRRQGIAAALKVHALLEAKRSGARVIVTDNEEKNPMLDLNKRLGFRHTFDGLGFKREILV